MSTISDEEIILAVKDYLLGADLDNITTKGMRNDIEKKFKCDLSSKKFFLKEILLKCMDELENNDDEEEVNNDNDNDTRETSLEKRKVSSGRNGFNALVQLSAALSEFMGKPFAQRTEVSKQVWIYIKANNLQNPKDKREILCDDKFRSLFKREKMGMFKMNKYLSEMMKNFEDLQDNTIAKEKSIKEEKLDYKSSDKKIKKRKLDSNEVDNSKSKKEKKVKKEKENGEEKISNPNNPFNKPMKLSSSLSSLIKSESESRPQVVKKLWEYIHSNNLQNPNDKRQIINDKSMEKVFKVKNMSMFEMNKLLSVHLTSIDE